MRAIKSVFIACLLISRLCAQSDSVLARDAKGKSLLRLGNNAMRRDDPASAATFFEAYTKQRPGDAQGHFRLGMAYMELRDYQHARGAFHKAYVTNRQRAPEALYYHAQMQKAAGHYDSARTNFQKFRKEYKGTDKKLKRQAAREIAICDSIGAFHDKRARLVIHRLDTSINKFNAEGAAIALNDSTMLFTSLRTEKAEFVTEGDTSNVPRQKMYYARKHAGGPWMFAGEWEMNDERYHNGNPCLSADRRRLYFTRCRENLMEEMKCAIYVSERDGDGWKPPVKLPSPVNLRRYSSTMPAVTADPVKGNEIIYFVSNRKKGRGGNDIWQTTYDKKLRAYKVPKNLGSKVNTAGDEITPFFDHDTRTLYFSSDGHSGLGGFDVYRTTGDGKRITGIENIGMPVNSGADELYYHISTSRNEGFFASNRQNDRLTKNRTCCDDLFSFSDPEYVQVLLTGVVMDMVNPDFPVPGARVDVYLKDAAGDLFQVRTVTTDQLGRYTVKLETEQNYEVIVKKKEFLNSGIDVSTKGVTQAVEMKRDIKVEKKPKDAVNIPNVQYEFGRADLTPASKEAIDRLLVDMLRKNPQLVVEVQAHTDSKGNDQYNQKLSQKRADNIVAYVISKGIPAERITGTGYGESMPIAPNENADGSDNPEGRAMNRRTEFKIIGEIAEEGE